MSLRQSHTQPPFTDAYRHACAGLAAVGDSTHATSNEQCAYLHRSSRTSTGTRTVCAGWQHPACGLPYGLACKPTGSAPLPIPHLTPPHHPHAKAPHKGPLVRAVGAAGRGGGHRGGGLRQGFAGSCEMVGGGWRQGRLVVWSKSRDAVVEARAEVMVFETR
jgi:hypothetical protein